MPIFTPAQCDADPILRYFEYQHLPLALQGVSEQFCTLAGFVVSEIPRNPERTVALRKLLEAKDAAVRSVLPVKGASREETFYTRLLSESRELEGRIEKLETFIGTTAFLALPGDQQALLDAQRSTMKSYAEILGRRIAALQSSGQGQAEAVEEIGEGVRFTGRNQDEEPLDFKA
jgi:hypothetical protein